MYQTPHITNLTAFLKTYSKWEPNIWYDELRVLAVEGRGTTGWEVTEACYIQTDVHVAFSGGNCAKILQADVFAYFIPVTSAAWFWVCSCCKQVHGSASESPTFSLLTAASLFSEEKLLRCGGVGRRKNSNQSLQHMSNLLLQQCSPWAIRQQTARKGQQEWAAVTFTV